MPRSGIMLTQSITRSYTFAIIATLPFLSIALSQGHDARFEHLGVEQGLSSESVFGIFQDSKGFMWFGTADGLNKYDGYGFTVYKYDPFDSNSIHGNNVVQIDEDSRGMLWLPGGYGLRGYDRATGKFTFYGWPGTDLVGPYPPDIHEDMSGTLWAALGAKGLMKFDRTGGTLVHYPLSCDTVYVLCKDPDEAVRIFWAGTPHGLDRFDIASGSFTHYDHGSRNIVYTIHGDTLGMLWVGTDEGLYKFNKATGTFSYYPVDKRVSASPERNDIRQIYEDKGGLLWIGTAAGLSRFDRATATFKEYRREGPSLPFGVPYAFSMIEDRRGEFWVATYGDGVGRYDRARDKFTFFTNDPKDPHSLSSNRATTVYEDKSGALWFGTWWNGVNKLDRSRKSFHHFTHNPADPNSLSDKSIFGLCEDRSGAVWVGTSKGLNRFDGRTGIFTQYYHDPHNPHSLAGNNVKCVLEDSRGMIWVGTNAHGLDRLDPSGSGGKFRGHERFVHYTHDPNNPNSLGSNSILSLFEDSSGKLWIGTADAGLDQFDRETGTFKHYEPDRADSSSLREAWVNAIYEDRSGRLWVGVGGGGLNKLDRSTGKFRHYGRREGLSYGSVHSIHEDSKGNLWVGTAAGLNRFDSSTETFTHTYTVRDGIASDFIAAILEDDNGCLWLKTGKGVSKFDPRTETFRNYDASDEVEINPIWGKASFKNKNGEMYIGGSNGFIHFHPDSIRDNPYVPPVVITGFRKFDKPVQLDTVISEKKVLELPYKDNVFSFEFVALNYTSPEKNLYAYMLDGFDEDWVYCGTQRYARYTNLDGGSYVFRVKGSNNDGVWNETGTSIVLHITPPFWATWWFKTIFFIAIAGSIGATIRHFEKKKLQQRLHSLEEQQALERERLRISRDMHDEVGANLTKISVLSELAVRKTEKTDSAAKELESISQTAREVIDNISAILWAINPRNDRLDNLTGYIREHASGFFEMTSLDCRFDFPAEVPGYPLSAEIRRNIFLTVKEALNNIIKHADATLVELDCGVSDHELGFSIQDNGKGFVIEDVPRHGNGLSNMRKRIEDIKGDFHIISKPGGGTRIRLTVPLK